MAPGPDPGGDPLFESFRVDLRISLHLNVGFTPFLLHGASFEETAASSVFLWGAILGNAVPGSGWLLLGRVLVKGAAIDGGA